MYRWCQKTCKLVIYDDLKTTYQCASQLSPIFTSESMSEPGDEL